MQVAVLVCYMHINVDCHFVIRSCKSKSVKSQVDLNNLRADKRDAARMFNDLQVCLRIHIITYTHNRVMLSSLSIRLTRNVG